MVLTSVVTYSVAVQNMTRRANVRAIEECIS